MAVAKRRVDKNITTRSTAHRSLREETQAGVLAESELSQATTEKVGEEIKKEIKQLGQEIQQQLGQTMRPLPSQIELASVMSGSSTAVSV